MARLNFFVFGLIISLTAYVKNADANETTTYSYDELGRLIGTATTGPINNGQNVITGFDPAGNRTSYAVSGIGNSTPTLSISNAAAIEGAPLIFAITRSGPLTGVSTVSVSSSNGTAIAPGDYTSLNGTVTFAIGEASKAAYVTTIDDAAVESSETISVVLSSPNGSATLGNASATGTINDNDFANRSPIAGADSFTMNCNSGGGFNIFTNDSDPDGNAITIASVASNGGISTSIGSATTGIVSIGAPSQLGTYTANYTITDGQGGSANAVITVTVTAGGPFCG